ncbi:MAG: 2-oxoacid:acceptor oxidoreductase family protein [Desulfovibrio sp.]|nr:2-oxoacid:acceptor oxidoreductase family protein [Desulfovibrio sp.]MBQ2477453.1 2-oxoacid:acceptor oxidoreductase family protein [Desulfovibrio sp.]MBQ2517177.1 2-oxoacid:acceptor oxidoreductase family protein [Desulfovibrio sp.]
MTSRFLLSGSGGQGVISLAILLAQAAALYGGHNAVQTQAYGPEARGGATRSDVIISDEEILFPQVLHPDVLVSLTNQACAKFLPLIRPNGIMLFDSDLVQPERRMDAHYVGLPMHREVVDKFHKTQALNICVLGVLLSLTRIVDVDAVRKCLADKFKPAFHEANNQALDLGLKLGESVDKTW